MKPTPAQTPPSTQLPTPLAGRPPARLLPPWGWLVVGVAITALAGMRFHIALLAWLLPVPWLLHLRQTAGWRSRLAFMLALQVGMFLQIAKIVTAPLPLVMAAMYSVPLALGAGLVYLLFEAWRRRVGDAWGLALFPALMVLWEWTTAHLSEIGSWGAVAYTQIDNLALMQSVSLFGLWGLTALMGLVGATLALALSAPRDRRWRGAAALAAALLVGLQAYGQVRLSRDLPGPRLTVAAVVSDIGMGPAGLPPPEVLAQGTDTLFARSERALARGADLVVWNEGATAISADQEPAFLARGRALAAAHDADLVLAYVVPLDEGMRSFENKYVWMTPDGPAETYHKHHPVPGEGSVRGTAPLAVLDRPYGKAAGAICYDYDFPALAREHARLDAGIVAVPSSDWKGIDPYHTQMAAVRGIEGGFSVVRPVRWATTGAFDPLGRSRGAMSWYEDEERVLIARVPTTRIPTLYSRIGDLLPLLAGGVLLVAGLMTPGRSSSRRG